MSDIPPIAIVLFFILVLLGCAAGAFFVASNDLPPALAGAILSAGGAVLGLGFRQLPMRGNGQEAEWE